MLPSASIGDVGAGQVTVEGRRERRHRRVRPGHPTFGQPSQDSGQIVVQWVRKLLTKQLPVCFLDIGPDAGNKGLSDSPKSWRHALGGVSPSSLLSHRWSVRQVLSVLVAGVMSK
ncbi:hypothetical protein GCM10022223_33830 [Kineosporia mesophila]|uniref:Uncharacterized protein n=1 Tax=Kineosporia mesophila TaxID=566012 RepID=A0ABP6ZTN7_9ACTN